MLIFSHIVQEVTPAPSEEPPHVVNFINNLKKQFINISSQDIINDINELGNYHLFSLKKTLFKLIYF